MAATYIERYCRACRNKTLCLVTESVYDETFYRCMVCGFEEMVDEKTGKHYKWVLHKCGDLYREELED